MGQGGSHAMPNAMADAQAQTQSAIHYYKPRTQSFINVTERAAAAGPRELAISATAWVVNPASFQWDYIAGAVRHGYVDKLRICLDALDVISFVPKITRVLSYADHVSYLEIFCDQLVKQAVIPCLAFPNILDSLPPRCDALTSFYLATTHTQLVHFDVIGKLMLRARNLKHLRLEGPQITKTSNSYEDYIPCHLQYLQLMFIDIDLPLLKEILVRSGKSLKQLHIEQVTGLDQYGLASMISLMLPSLQYLTVIIPDHRALASVNVELMGIMDEVLAEPLISCQYLYCGGLAITNGAFTRKVNNRGILVTPLPGCQSLYLKDCRSLKPAILTDAIKTGRLPKVKRLEALWPLADIKPEEYTALCAACDENGIAMSEAMTTFYAPYVSEKVMDAEQANKILDEDVEELTRKIAMLTPDIASTITQVSSTREASSSKHKKRHKHRHKDDRDNESRHHSDDGRSSRHSRSTRKSKHRHRSRARSEDSDSSGAASRKSRRHHKRD